MPRLREVPKAEVHEFGAVIYEMLFGDRDPVAEPGTEDTSPFVTVYLKGGNRLQVVGSMADADHVRFIRHHVIRSLTFGG